jgi:hypothetical protein
MHLSLRLTAAARGIALATRTLRTPIVLRCIDDYLAGQRLPLSAINDPLI